MFKRVFWMTTGMAVGAAGAFWAKRRVEETIENYLPEQVADRAATSVRNLGRTVREAAREGQAAMRATEAELRSRVDERTFTGTHPEGHGHRPSRPITTMGPTSNRRHPRR